jgi:riboflavin kinase / FMN adenylyltransferase
VWITSSLDTAKTPTCVALGNFDGVHRGHRQVIRPVCKAIETASVEAASVGTDELVSVSGIPAHEEEKWQPLLAKEFYLAKELSPTALATVVTFHPHPQEFFSGQRRLLLMPLAEKVHYLSEMGIEQLVQLPFDQVLANLTPQAFVEKLVQCLQVQQISVGEDFRFGRRRSGTAEDLRAIAAQYHVPVSVVPLYQFQDERISSSAIRLALEQGEVDRANQLLGRPYTLLGQVVQGQQLGRTIGFPTANLQLPPEKFLPRQGVYSVWVHLGGLKDSVKPVGLKGKNDFLPGVMNIGTRPTVNGTVQTVEVHLLGWTGDLYGQTIAVYLDSFLRPEQKFASLDDLKAQIQQDGEMAEVRLLRS